MGKIRVGVTGINAIDNPGPGIGVIRSLKEDKELQVEAVGLAYDAMDPGIYMDWLVDKAFLLPYPSGNLEDFLSRLEHIKGKVGLDVVIPTLDAELPLFITAAQRLKDMGIKTFLPTKTQYDLRDKTNLEDVADQVGIQYPASRTVNGLQELKEAVNELKFPVMVKGLYYRAYRADNLQEASGFFDSIVEEWGYPVIVQQVVTGDEMNVIGLGYGTGRSLGLMGIKKLWITQLGKIWTGVTIKNEPMMQAAARFINSYQWKGSFELECIVSGEQTYLIEINPRFPAWVYFCAGVGINLPARLLRTALDLPVDNNGHYEAGKLYVRYTNDLVTDLTAFQSIVTKAERI